QTPVVTTAHVIDGNLTAPDHNLSVPPRPESPSFVSPSFVSPALAPRSQVSQTGHRVSGAVIDPLNLGVPGVAIVLSNADSSIRQQVSTDAAGQFEVSASPDGEYTLEARLPGFATLKESVSIGANVD